MLHPSSPSFAGCQSKISLIVFMVICQFIELASTLGNKLYDYYHYTTEYLVIKQLNISYNSVWLGISRFSLHTPLYSFPIYLSCFFHKCPVISSLLPANEPDFHLQIIGEVSKVSWISHLSFSDHRGDGRVLSHKGHFAQPEKRPS